MTENSLKRYHDKRDFHDTPEPRGRVAKSKGNQFVIQKHAARRLHFDFRLELDGVLKSWAITRGPSLNPSDKRLAVRTEDHPVDYGGFEGVIPRGYGAGTVMLWDRGQWQPLEDPHVGLEKGALKFILEGERLQGAFALVRMQTKGEKKENWLLIKQRDEFSSDEIDPIETWATSVKSDRTLREIELQGEDYHKGKYYAVSESKSGRVSSKPAKGGKKIRVQFIPPQLATLRPQPPEGDEWLHEVKYDGYRIQALIEQGAVRLITRNKKDWTHRYPKIAHALAQLKVNQAILDGELVALDKHGASNFTALQNAAENSSVVLTYYAFDLLYLDGESLTRLPLLQRKEQLQKLLGKKKGTIHYSDHIQGEGERVIKKACAMKLEGIVSKLASSTYRSGRGISWIKSKCSGDDEFVIAGYRKSDKAGRSFSSLILGEYVKGELLYRGRVGTGFDANVMRELMTAMAPLVRKTTPLRSPPAEARSRAVWLRPTLVAQIAYTERTADGRLRHPSFKGMREDKPVVEVTAAATDIDDSTVTIAGVRLTHPGRVMYPQQGVTKRAVAEYYQRYAQQILPFVKHRPVSLVRCPSGRDKECFFQRHHNASVPEELDRISIVEKNGKHQPYLVINTSQGLVAAAQIGALELHVWGSRTDRLESPERLVFDLDPDESVSFAVVRAAALELRNILEVIELQSYALLTGGKGVHVVVPLVRRRGWEDVKAFSHGLAAKLQEAAPDRYVTSATKAKRRGKIFIDWLRNERGATAVAPYSLRARKNAPVATPVSWEELPGIKCADRYTLDNISERLAHMKRDPWDGYHELRQTLTQAQMDSVRQ